LIIKWKAKRYESPRLPFKTPPKFFTNPMLARIVIESLARRRFRRLLSFVAVALGVTVAVAVGTLALDVGDKVGRELRSFGANISVTPSADSLTVAIGGVDYRPAGAGAFLPESALPNLKKIFWRNNIVAFAPLLYVPIQAGGRRTVLIGTWFEKAIQVDETEVFRSGLKQLHPAWRVSGKWPSDDDSAGALVGRRLAERLGVKTGQVLNIALTLPFPEGAAQELTRTSKPQAPDGRNVKPPAVELTVRGILDTGGPDDDDVLALLATVQKLAGLEGKIRRIEVSALTRPEDAFARADVSRLSPEEFDRWFCTPYVSSIAYQIRQAIPGAEAKPVYQVAETEGRIMNRVGVLMALLAGAALVTAALAVASMMLASVLERRQEIGLFKSLGATDGRASAVFLLEAGMVGLVGGVLGYFAGSLLAWRLALAVFGTPVGLHWVILPASVALAWGVTLLGGAFPLARAMKIPPALALKD
jgi:putative ABC transport system permease protein